MIQPLFKPINAIKSYLNNIVIHDNNIDKLIIPTANYDNILSNKCKLALYNFLLEYKDSAETLKYYLKELERLILWCNFNKLDILSLNREYIIKYQQFLQQPTPTDLWCGNKVPKLLKTGQINPKWRAFYKELSPPSIKKILRVIDSFFNYLVQTNYLPGNPLAVTRRRNKNNPFNKIIDRYLELDEINFLLESLTNYSAINNHKIKDNLLIIRAKYIILLLFYTGMRISEAALHTMGNFMQRDNNWFLAVVGKGNKHREIPIPDELLDSLSQFRQSIGLPYLPEFKEATPLIPNIDLKSHLTTRRIDQIIKWAFNIGAEYLAPKHPHKASKLKLASAHWLRHSYVTYLLNSGASLKVAQENAGHSDVGTTMLYTHVNQVDRHKATRNLSLKNNDDTDDDDG
jgi:site-specific recombinase XerD